MKQIIAYCGLICNDCPAFIATNENNQQKKTELAHQWSNENYTVTPEDINCSGCTTACNNIFKFCRECEIRLWNIMVPGAALKNLFMKHLAICSYVLYLALI